ncbi:Phosphoribosylamine--glycine ligase [Gemmatirosa kalamazoonensis]|uniref:Phosphoribosylamine--glycine ligase n=1 Tax=Gemmatirosa kalamazoonensis TaxID=861299 RepID=W0RM93_9BACT|nr:phosphoribosylamine--glycine ligase [Gemmatirosa kalamazoonensis]AHG91435.1 Phosphoribosylamine--glycine ligase [Gemmatirosa kalamazoonensis]
MKVLLVGGGGREHALAWKLKRENPDTEIVAAPGNPGIATLGRCVNVSATDVDALVALAEQQRPAFTLVGPEAPLAAGLVDRFRARGLPAFGPTQDAAEIETSKAFAKRLMLDAGVPTARATRHTDPTDAKRAAAALGAPVVVKYSGLAAGKGVVVAHTMRDAERAIDDMLVGHVYGEAEVLVEEFMEGEELSVFYLTDGHAALPLVPAQDHKRLHDGDEGPNTGGMGAYAPVSLDAGDALERIVLPTLGAMRDARRPFTGLLYAGLMLTADGPRVVEFNCRFGDPETQAVLPVMDALGLPLGELMLAIARGDRLPDAGWTVATPPAAVTTVLAAHGYPEKPRTGDPIELPAQVPAGVEIFHAGTKRDADGRLVTAGGRVLAVTAVAPSFDDARATSRAVAESIRFDGRQMRRDIGWREAERLAGTARD